jgi:TonB family protein
MRAMGLAVAGLLSLGAGGLAWAAQPGPGTAERLAAEPQNAAHPNYTCDRAMELRGEGCKIVNVATWRALPTHDDLLRLYPPAALKAGVTAQVAISCGITPEGSYKDCAAVETTVRAPEGVTVADGTRAAFGKAAVALSRYYQARLPERPRQGWNGHAVAMIVFSPDWGPGLPPRPGAVPARDLPPLPPAAAPAQVSQAAPARKVMAAFAPPPGPDASAAPSGKAAQTPEAALAAFLQSPNWSRRPTAEDLVQTYPPEAVKAHLEGDVVLHCHVTAAGKLADCGVLRETPQGAGFGAAALKLTPLFEAREQTPQGGPKRGTDIRIPIRFRLPTPPPAP